MIQNRARNTASIRSSGFRDRRAAAPADHAGAGDTVTEETPGGFGVGSRLAGYRLDEEIGRGGMAVVYRAYDTRLERPVALKVLAPQLAEDPGFRQRFIRESRTAAAVDHPNIIPIFEAGEAGGVLFIAMRFVHGPDVQTLIDNEGPFSAVRACNIITQVAGALEAAHAHGLVHRDVKPGNILLDASTGPGHPGHAYLSDFGLSKRALSSSALTSTGQFLGTLDYIAPEQIEARAVDGRTDEYALACAAYTMLTGQPPFVRDESIAVMWAQISAPPPPITSRRPDLPAAVADVLAKALAKVPADRYATCPQFAAALRRACGLESGDEAAGRPRPEPTRLAAPAEPPPAGSPPAGPSPAGSPAAGSPAAGQHPATARGTSPGEAAPPSGATPAGQGWVIPAGPGQTARGEVPADRGAEPSDAGEPPTEQVALGMLGGGRPRVPGPGGGAGARGATPPARGPSARGPYGRGPSGPAGPPGSAGGPGPGRGRGRHRARTATIAVGCVAVLAVGGGLYLSSRGGGSASGGQATQAAFLTPPGCTTTVARSRQLPVTSQQADVSGGPFDVAVQPGYAFISTTNGHLGVFSTAKSPPSLLSANSAPGSLGETLTPDHHYLVVSGGGGLTVFRVADLEHGPATPVGSLSVPGQKHAVEVVVTPDGRYALVTFQESNHVGVFDLQRALTSGFGPADVIGLIPVTATPIGIALSPDGQRAYVTSAGTGGPGQGPTVNGVLSIIDVRTATNHPAKAVSRTVMAGCGPSRVVVSADGQHVWVTAASSNALLGFSAAKLLSDPGHALVARQTVGPVPLGLILVKHGTRIVVADSDRGSPASAANLAVIDVPRALAHRPALLGYLAAGKEPRQFALLPGGGTLLVTNTRSSQLQSVDLTHLP